MSLEPFPLEAIEALNGKRAARGGRPIRVRIGAQTGLVVLGEVSASDTRQERAVVGDTPNLASRLQGLAEPGTFLLGPGTMHLVAGQFECEDLGEHQLKGLAHPIRAHRVRGAVERATRFAARVRGLVSPMAGRSADLQRLRELWAQACTSAGSLALVSGEPGIGESRLTVALTEEICPPDSARLCLQCSPYDQNSAFFPVLRQLESVLEISPRDDNDLRLEKLLAGLGGDGGDAALESAALLAPLLGIPAGDRLPSLFMSPAARKQKTLQVLADWLVGHDRRSTLLILLEDAHWIDPSTLELLELAVTRLRERRILCVLTSRPEFAPPAQWEQLGYVAHFKLGRLDRDGGAEIVRHVAHGKAIPERVLSEILDKTDGVPLFLEELTSHVLESGLLAEEAEAWRLTRPLGAVEIPATLQGSLTARLDRLGPAKETAQLAAAIGRRFTREVLAAVDARPVAELDAALDRLVASQLVFADPAGAPGVFVFKHALVQDAAYDSLLKKTRRQVHERIGGTLERLHADRLEEAYELLARHYQLSPNKEKAVAYLDCANQKAIRASAMNEAYQYFLAALALLDELPDVEAHRRRRIGLMANQVPALILLLKFHEHQELFLRHMEVAESLGDADLLGRWYCCIGHFHYWLGRFDEAIRVLTLAVTWCEKAGNVEALGRSYVILEWSNLYIGEHEKALALSEPARRATEQARDLRYLVWAYTGASWALSHQGKWEAAEALGLTALKRAEDLGEFTMASFAAFIVAIPNIMKGDYPKAIAYGQKSARYAATPGDQAWSQCYLCWARCRAGDFAGTLDIQVLMVGALRAAHFAWGEANFGRMLADSQLLAGRREEARNSFEEALAVAARCNMRFLRGSCLRFLAELDLLDDATPRGTESAAARLTESAAVLRELGAENELALVDVAWGRVCLRQEKKSDARRRLAQALAAFERLGTQAGPEEARRLLAEAGEG
ncbi:MAG: AAA family ATPase [Planctomycetes bacterium]|nr:AAA family ATPase [Planctomycetota bacterium]